MSQTKSYLIKLRPADRFFFGGERTFGDNNAHYLVHSRLFPQQTALLGLLRYKLLEWKGLLQPFNGEKIKSNDATTQSLIGDKSFQTERPNALQSFGVIHSISPVFLTQGPEALQPAPKDWEITFKKDLDSAVCYTAGGKKSFIPVLEGYDAKRGIESRFIRQSDGCIFGEDEIFIRASQIGILKNSKGESDEDGFYKQTYYRFPDLSYAFAFIATLDSNTGDDFAAYVKANEMVYFGGERSLFFMEISDLNPNWSPLDLPQHTYFQNPQLDIARAILLSDAFLENTIYQYCDFAISDTIDFRSILTTLDVKNYYALSRNDKENDREFKPQKSAKYNLLEKGSVFYFSNNKQLDAFIKVLQVPAAFCQIGYNGIQIIKNEQFS